MPRIQANVTPEVMLWARKKSGYSVEDAAGKIGRPVEEIQAWELGKLKPTLAQARNASEVYKRPLAVFFLPEPPKDFDTLRDFRKLPKDIPAEYSPQLAYIIRRIRNRQQWLSEFLLSEGYSPLNFIGSASINVEPVKLAAEIRQSIRINLEDIFACRSRSEALRLWIDCVEQTGVFVCQAGNLKHEKVSVEEARGASMTDRYAPFVFLNAQDAKAAQLFSLAHELVHLWINEPGLSNLMVPRRPSTDTEKIEVFCNKVAAEILVPLSLFKTCLQKISKETIESQITNLSMDFKVSREVIARRFFELGKIKQDYYKKLIQKFKREWLKQKELEKRESKTKDRGPDYNLLKIINNGRAFTQTVINAYGSGEISGVATYNLLEIKLNRLPTVADMLHLPLTGRRSAL
ncbi:ImmA/IrrE family metallo-endopeptidase [Planctomycetota bacterium]